MSKIDSDPAVKTKAERTVENVREHYERGRRGRQKTKDESAKIVAEKLGVNVNTFRKERRFAKLYSEDALADLLALRRPDGMPLHWGHIVFLITVEDETKRLELQKQAAEQSWTAADLRDAIRDNREPAATRGGRPIKVPDAPTAARRLLFQETERWLQRYRAITGKHPTLLKTIPRADRELANALESLLTEMSRLSRQSEGPPKKRR